MRPLLRTECQLSCHCFWQGGVRLHVVVSVCRQRSVLAQARTLAPAIIFIDEIDAVGRIRGGAMGNDERDQTLNQARGRQHHLRARMM